MNEMENTGQNNSSFSMTSNTLDHQQSHEKLADGSIFLACLYSIISFIAVFGNLLVITAIFWDRTLRLYTSNYFLANLAVADFFQGAVAIPLRVLEVLGAEYNPSVFCRVAIPTSILFGASSNLAILVISIDRFLAVKYPYIYTRYATTNFIIAVIAFCWSVAAVLSLIAASKLVWIIPDTLTRICRFPVYLKSDYIIAMYVIVHAIPIGTVVLLYGFILQASLVHSRQIHAQELAVVASVSMCSNSNVNETDTTISTVTNGRKKQQRETARQRKAAKTVSIIVGLFIILVVPIIAIDLAEMLGAPPAPLIVTKICVFMIFANNCVNVVVYAGFNQDFRLAFKKILLKIARSVFRMRTYR